MRERWLETFGLFSIFCAGCERLIGDPVLQMSIRNVSYPLLQGLGQRRSFAALFFSCVK